MENIEFKIECSTCYGLGKIPDTDEHCYMCDGKGKTKKTIITEESNSSENNSKD